MNAAALWTNGAVNSNLTNDNRCDSGPNQCGNTGGAFWTVFDNFNVNILPVGVTWGVTGFDITDFLVNGTTADIGATNWTIWNGDPLSGGKVVASGSGTATPTLLSGTCGNGSTCLEILTLNIATVFLPGGTTYYLGTTTTLTANNANEALLRAFASGGNTAPGGTANGLTKWEQSNGSTTGVAGSFWTSGTINNTFPGSVPETATAFDLFGSVVVPEPASASLGMLALSGLTLIARKRC